MKLLIYACLCREIIKTLWVARFFKWRIFNKVPANGVGSTISFSLFIAFQYWFWCMFFSGGYSFAFSFWLNPVYIFTPLFIYAFLDWRNNLKVIPMKIKLLFLSLIDVQRYSYSNSSKSKTHEVYIQQFLYPLMFICRNLPPLNYHCAAKFYNKMKIGVINEDKYRKFNFRTQTKK